MGNTHFPWDDLLDLMLPTQCVVPIIGESLITLESRGEQRIFSSLLAEKLAEKHGLSGATLSDVAAQLMKKGYERIQIGLDLNRIQRHLLADLKDEQIGEPLRQLAATLDFPLILTTGTSALVEYALRASGNAATKVVLPMEGNADLPENWAPSNQPTLVHLFGQVAPEANFALTEEDTLESLCQLHDKRRPERLVGVLRGRHLLFLGTGFPNWLSRMFMRALRDCRPSLDRNTIKAIVEDGEDVKEREQISVFLQYFASQTWLYTEGSAAQFVTALHQKWQTARGRAAAANAHTTATVDAPTTATEMPEGAVFVSYTSEDRARAEVVVSALNNMGLEAWFDQNDLRAGEAYEAKIRRNINRCDLFIALISQHTEKRDEGYFLREWRWATERAAAMRQERRFIVPIVVDELEIATLTNVPFKELTMQQALGGNLPQDLLADLVQAIRRIRSSRAAA